MKHYILTATAALFMATAFAQQTATPTTKTLPTTTTTKTATTNTPAKVTQKDPAAGRQTLSNMNGATTTTPRPERTPATNKQTTLELLNSGNPTPANTNKVKTATTTKQPGATTIKASDLK